MKLELSLAAFLAAACVFASDASARPAPLAPVAVKKAVIPVRRAITVSIIGMDHAKLPPDGKPNVQAMIDYWTKAMDREIGNHPDLIVLPEICDMWRFAPKDESFHAWLEMRGDLVLKAFQAYAGKHRCYLAYPTYRQTGERRYANCIIFIDRDGDVISVYDKVYETIRGVQMGVEPGKGPVTVDTDFGKVGFLLCFDLNFWNLMERYAAEKPDVLIFSSYYDGDFMRRAWALRCGAYLVASTVGELPKTIVGPSGEELRNEKSYFRTITDTINTDFQVVHLDGNWKKLADAVAKYGRRITVRNPGGVGTVTLLSNDSTLPIDRVVSEFGIELWSEYYARSKNLNDKAR